MMTFPDIIDGQRIALTKHKLNPQSLKNFVDIVKSNQEFLYKYTDFGPFLKTEANIVKYFENSVTQINKTANYAIIEKQANTIIGDLELYNIDENFSSANIAYWLAQNKTNQGFASEAVNLFTNYFILNGITSIKAIVSVKNKNSIKLLNTTGFKEFDEGLFQALSFYKTKSSR